MKIETPLLRRLGPIPFWRGEKKCLPELDRLYKKAHSFAIEQSQAICAFSASTEGNVRSERMKRRSSTAIVSHPSKNEASEKGKCTSKTASCHARDPNVGATP